jgi:GNAT superfamily N-acetyltransferase
VDTDQQKETHAQSAAAKLATACEKNLISKFLSFSELPGALQGGPNPLWYCTGSQFAGYNGVLTAKFQPPDCTEAIEEATKPFRLRNLPLTWWVGPSSEPASLGTRLTKTGFSHTRDLFGMGVELSKLEMTREAANVNVDFEEIETPAQLDEWMQVYVAGFKTSTAAARETHDKIKGLRFRQGSKWHHYTARENGRLVAISSLFISNEIGGLYNLAVLPEARRRGIGSALSLKTFEQAEKLGCRIGILQTSSPEAIRVYHRLGMDVYCKFVVYQKYQFRSV